VKVKWTYIAEDKNRKTCLAISLFHPPYFPKVPTIGSLRRIFAFAQSENLTFGHGSVRSEGQNECGEKYLTSCRVFDGGYFREIPLRTASKAFINSVFEDFSKQLWWVF
jgi:hypothetical protein